jgi:hypothetical protein
VVIVTDVTNVMTVPYNLFQIIPIRFKATFYKYFVN